MLALENIVIIGGSGGYDNMMMLHIQRGLLI